MLAGTKTLLRFQGARHDHVRVKSSSCCFSTELVSFDQQHVTCSPPIRFELVGQYSIMNAKARNSRVRPLKSKLSMNE